MARPDAAALGDALAEVLGLLDLPTYAYFFLPPDSGAEARLISNYPEKWTSHYLSNRYDRIDPVIAEARVGGRPFNWGPQAGPNLRPESQREFFEEAARFGIRCGFTVPIHDGALHTAALTFAADERQARFERCIAIHKPALHLIGALIHRSARRLFVPDRAVAGVLLSPREFQCLEWAAEGKSAWEISRLVGISQRTAAYHLENAKRKLGVRTISQAVARFASSKPGDY